MAAEAAAGAGCAVTVYDQMPRPGRKFLLAGRGGLNLTHSEPLDAFLTRYREGGEQLAPLIRAFPPDALRAWADGLGADTFVGSSGRVFPKAMKASPLLRCWLQRLAGQGVVFEPRRRFAGFTDAGVLLETPDAARPLAADAYVLAFGGASWPELGSDGEWRAPLRRAGCAVESFRPSNVGIEVKWPQTVWPLHGKPFKMLDLYVGGQRFRGEAILTRSGMEGGAIYAANAALRAREAQGAPFGIALDLQPNRTESDIAARLAKRDKRRSLGRWLQKTIGLSPVSARLAVALSPDRTPSALAETIKQAKLLVYGFAGLRRAISSAGGLTWDEVDASLMLKRRPGVFVAGEMLDWDAPTGGYLLQACFATGRAAGLAAAAYAKEKGG
jgi:uncharacterized flavoprotein (TIGR03862 family)